jgi:simple sugar transport system ATP-binding protein
MGVEQGQNANRQALLEMRRIEKSFPGVRALQGVDFTVRAGEVHALMGENGAGKSTLIKVLTGVYPRDKGTVTFEAKPIRPGAPVEAEALGISTVYQEVNLIPHLSVAENIVLGRQPKQWGFLSWGAIRRRAVAALERLDLRFDVGRELASCSVAIQQMTAIARALDIQARLLVLDEPTASLDEKEVGDLFRVMRNLRAEGLGIVFVTHFLDQVYEISDRITVLRNGALVGEFEADKLPRLALIGRMLGKEPSEVEMLESVSHKDSGAGSLKVVLDARGLGRRGSVAPLDIQLRAGEVLGLAGLLGSGRTETARLLFGIDRADSGRVTMEDGRRVSMTNTRVAIRNGIGFCSEDRKSEGIIPDLSVRENIVLALQAGRGALRQLRRKEQEKIAEHYIRALGIRTPTAEAPIKTLSGGNQQKVLLARWMAMQPKLIILDEPTRGIDVGAKAEIETLVADLRAQGVAVLFISSELEEVVRDCQRVIVLRDRKKLGELEGAAIDEQNIMAMIASTR